MRSRKETDIDYKELIERHASICNELGKLYADKNADYGDSFHETYIEEGMAMPRIRLSDKLNRFKALTRKGKQQVSDESIRDTLLDLANYAIMTIMEIDREEARIKLNGQQSIPSQIADAQGKGTQEPESAV